MKIKVSIKVEGKEYELTPEGGRKPTDDVEIDINIDPEDKNNIGYIDESRSKFSPISVHKGE